MNPLSIPLILDNNALFQTTICQTRPKKSKLCFIYLLGKKLVKFSHSVQCATTKISCIKFFAKHSTSFAMTFTIYFRKCPEKWSLPWTNIPDAHHYAFLLSLSFPNVSVHHFVVHFYTWCHHNRLVIFFYLADNSQNAFLNNILNLLILNSA